MCIYTENIIFPCFSWERSSFIFRPKKKYHIFRKKTIFPDNTRKIIFQHDFFVCGKITFRGIWIKYHISIFFFFLKKRSSFIFRLRNKIIFWGKRNIIFPHNTTRKIIIQCYFFGKTIFLEHLKKISKYQNMVFCAVILLQQKRNANFIKTYAKIKIFVMI